ncbi:MAG: hypothetical protein QW292_14135 [Candidatus Parvarchaeota archaeon]
MEGGGIKRGVFSKEERGEGSYQKRGEKGVSAEGMEVKFIKRGGGREGWNLIKREVRKGRGI